MEYLIIPIFLILDTAVMYFLIKENRQFKKSLVKQSFAMTVAMGEYHMWVKDHLYAYLTHQVLNNEEFINFAKKNGIPLIKFEEVLEQVMKDSANYIKIQSDICLRKVSEPLAEDINAILEKQ
jgi:hypothetical protein